VIYDISCINTYCNSLQFLFEIELSWLQTYIENMHLFCMKDFRESNKLAQPSHSWLIVISFSSTVSDKYVCFN